jgi:NMD protein affecting ribosome stability and mRNA decay
LNDKLALMFSRAWGYRDGEDVPADGKYRCHLCNRFFGIENPEIDLKAGTKFPACKNCTKLRKRPQWYQLLKHKPF